MIDMMIRLLRHPIIWTRDAEYAQRSRFQWGGAEQAYPLSSLGMINGLLSWLGRVLVAKVDDETGWGVGFGLRRPWW